MIRRIGRSIWARAAVTMAVLVVLLSRVDLRDTLGALRRLDLGLAALVAVLLVVDRGIMIWRWVILLRAREVPVSVSAAARIFLVSSFVGASTALAGDAARAYSLSRHTHGSEAVASVAVDRMLGMLGIVAVGLLGLAAAGASLRGESGLSFVVTAAVLSVMAVAALSADQWMHYAVPGRFHDATLGRRVLTMASALGAYRGHRAALAGVMALSTLVQLVRILQAYLLGLAIGIVVPFSYYLLFMPAGLVALMLPISIAGFGAPQGLIVWLLQPRGVPVPDALALSTLIVLSGLAANLPGALLVLLGRRRA
ncbi:MAG: lysylphosphatidylglycerol synthase transmembrane domain-containing protein [Vicinamibacterales bacterium]